MAIELWPKKCVDCGADVAYNGSDEQYAGFGPCKRHPGKHRVESVIFYHSGARDIQDQRDRRRFSPQIVLKQGITTIDNATGVRKIITNGLMVQFSDGKLETSDPEIQFYLHSNAQCASGPEGLRMWREIYLNEHQQADIIKAENQELEVRNRKLREDNALLESVKANQRSGKPASA
jgi:hypothetical protein